jgi:hypothetical protein
MKKCSKCQTNERFSNYNAYCRPCKNEVDLKSYHANQEKRRKYQDEYLEKHPDKKAKCRTQTKNWLKKNEGYATNWMANERKINPHYHIKASLYASLHHYLKKEKKNHMVWFLGCTIQEFKVYLESKFQEGMNWDNYGMFGWHIDHIKPVSLFDLKDEQQLKECWNYKNFQPLWATDNLKKGNSYEEKITHDIK